MASTRKVRNLDDLAERAGVTAATVSMALRNSPLLSEKMRERICRLAEESGFKPRTYRRRALPKETAEDGENGPLLVLYYEFPGEPDPVREGIMPALFLMLNERRIEYRYISCQELMADPSIVKDYRGILFYNDPEDFVLPPDIPAAQVFGWEPMREGQDRVTTNDSLVVRLPWTTCAKPELSGRRSCGAGRWLRFQTIRVSPVSWRRCGSGISRLKRCRSTRTAGISCRCSKRTLPRAATGSDFSLSTRFAA